MVEYGAVEKVNRIYWADDRMTPNGLRERYFVIAEKENGNWKFYDRSTWDVRWFEVVGPDYDRLLKEIPKRLEQQVAISKADGRAGRKSGLF